MKRKMLASLLVTALSISMLAGCGNEKPVSESANTNTEVVSNTETQQSEPVEEVKEPDKLTIWVAEDLVIQDWKGNAQTKWLEENGNFDLEFVVMPATDYNTKVSMALTVGDIDDLPDVIMGEFKNDAVWEYAQAETILPLTEYYDDPELSPNIHAWYEKFGEKYTSSVVSPDGNLYGIATYNQNYGNQYPFKLWLYKPWLDALGEDLPTTTEELFDLFKKVKETDLNGNGKADEIPMLGNKNRYKGYFNYIMNAYTYASTAANYLMVEDGKLSASYVTDEWKEGLRFIKKFFDEGLILEESLTMDDAQAEALMNAEVPTVFSLVRTSTSVSIYKDDYICCDTVTGPEGVNLAQFNPTSATMAMLVTANCENPEAAFRLGDLLSSEEMSITTRYGQRGVDWDYAEDVANASAYVAKVEGFDLKFIAYDDAAFWGTKEPQTSSWRQTGPYVMDFSIGNGIGVEPSTAEGYAKYSTEGMIMYQNSARRPEEVVPQKFIFTAEEQEKVADISAALLAYMEEFKANVLVGNIDLDAKWDAYVAEIEKIGLEEWLNVTQAAYDRMSK